jgi:hypothetical protein
MDDLAARKEVLIARSAVQRARLRYEVLALRSRPRQMSLPLGFLLGLFLRRSSPVAASGLLGKLSLLFAIVQPLLALVKTLRRKVR